MHSLFIKSTEETKGITDGLIGDNNKEGDFVLVLNQIQKLLYMKFPTINIPKISSVLFNIQGCQQEIGNLFI